MTEPTDTNQASEDELYNIIRTLAYDAMESGVDNSKHGYIYNAIDELLPTAKAAIQSAIRTEKLKLLAEVRERVIGEDYDIPAEMEKVGRDFQKLDAIAKTGGLLNKFKADLRTKLTKLEAEL